MPRRDGTGPMGRGSMTGRGAGFCNDDANFPAFNNNYRGSFDRPRRFYRQNESQASDSKQFTEDEQTYLKKQESFLQGQLESIQKRLSELSE